MDIIQNVISIPTMAMLKTYGGNLNDTVLLLGRDAPRDGKGGLYSWKVDNTSSESLTFMERVFVTGITYGYWERLYLSARNMPHGIVTNNGGVKRFYSTSSYLTDANGECSINLTEDNTTTGTAIFTEIWWNSSRPRSPLAPSTALFTTPNDVVTGQEKQTSANLKLTTHLFTRGNNQTLGATLLAIAGTIITGTRSAPTGTPVQFCIEGI